MSSVTFWQGVQQEVMNSCYDFDTQASLVPKENSLVVQKQKYYRMEGYICICGSTTEVRTAKMI